MSAAPVPVGYTYTDLYYVSAADCGSVCDETSTSYNADNCEQCQVVLSQTAAATAQTRLANLDTSYQLAALQTANYGLGGLVLLFMAYVAK